MGLLTFLILLLVSGLVVGALARLALPGPDPMSIWATIGIGIAGSFIAGLIASAVTGRNAGSFVLSVLVATALVYVVRRRRGQSLWSTRRDPGGSPRF
jgi:uncharacterized membrane protein YeaQ/YmgE (transglycosylase-associated protein family)